MNERDKPDGKEMDGDPYLEDVLADALGPLAALLPPDELAAMKRALREAATKDPALAALHKAARPRVAPARSGAEDPSTGEEASGDSAGNASVVRLKRRGSAA